jgi:hypothetical protein
VERKKLFLRQKTRKKLEVFFLEGQIRPSRGTKQSFVFIRFVFFLFLFFSFSPQAN